MTRKELVLAFIKYASHWRSCDLETSMIKRDCSCGYWKWLEKCQMEVSDATRKDDSV